MKKSQNARPAPVIVEITAVKIINSVTASNNSAISVLQDAGFEDVKINGSYIEGISPRKDRTFLLEYHPQRMTGVHYAPFRIVCLNGGIPSRLDHGEILFTHNNMSGGIEISAKGDEVVDWEMSVEPTTYTQIPVKGYYRESDIEDAVKAFDNNRSRREGELPSVARGLIAIILDRRQHLSDLLESQCESPVVEKLKQEIRVQPDICQNSLPWPNNQQIATMMREKYNGDMRVATICEALHEIVQRERLSVRQLSIRLNDYDHDIGLLLSVRNLHPDLRPLLDKVKGDPERISPAVLYVLVRTPLDKQLELWREASRFSGKNRNTRVVMEINSRGSEYIRAFRLQNRRFWEPWEVCRA